MVAVDSVQILCTVRAAPAAPTVREFPQRAFASIDEAITAYGLPSTTDATYVPWQDSDGTLNVALKRVRDTVGTNGVLVLPDRTDPYLVDVSRGFRAPGVTAVDDWPKFNPGGAGWFSAVRGARGIVGLGPNVTIGMTNPGAWTAPQQGAAGVWGYTDSAGAHVAFSDAACAVVDFDQPGQVFANFKVAESLNLGGVSYSFFHCMDSTKAGTLTVRAVTGHGSWRGHLGYPNGETGLFATNNLRLDLQDVWADGALSDGTIVGTSPIMVNNASATVATRIMCRNAIHGMPTWYRCTGTHTFNDFHTEGFFESQSFNLEANYDGSRFVFNGGSLVGGGSNHTVVGVGDYVGDMVEVSFHGTAFPSGAPVLVQEYSNGATKHQTQGNIAATDANGQAVAIQYAIGK